jgi:hypothetical protein
LASGTVPDIIVDADHTIAYLKFAATRNLLSTNGSEQQGNQRLSPVSGDYIHPSLRAGMLTRAEMCSRAGFPEEDHDHAGPCPPPPS